MNPTSESKDGLEQVREIVVGAIQRELERRVARVESHLVARANDLQLETRRRTEMIEKHLEREVAALATRTESESIETREAQRSAGRELRETSTALEQRVAKLEEALVKTQHALRQEILAQGKVFLDELQNLRRELTDTLERELGSFPSEDEVADTSGREEPRESDETTKRSSP
jgi:hypothetical protein